MQHARGKTNRTARHGINPSNLTLFRMAMAGIGFVGIVFFGFLMDTSLAPGREISGADGNYGFNSFTNAVTIPGFIVSLFIFSYSVYELYKVYRKLNDPNSYGNKSRRISS